MTARGVLPASEATTHTHCAAAFSPLVYASSLSFMWLPHGLTALPNQREIWGNAQKQEFTVTQGDKTT